MHCVGGRAGDLRSVEDLDRMIANSLRDVPDDEDDDLSDTDDPELLVSHCVVCNAVTSASPHCFYTVYLQHNKKLTQSMLTELCVCLITG